MGEDIGDALHGLLVGGQVAASRTSGSPTAEKTKGTARTTDARASGCRSAGRVAVEVKETQVVLPEIVGIRAR